MNNEKAIVAIDSAKAEIEWAYPMEYAVAFDMAIEALEKQIPKKPIIDGTDIYNAKGYYCPNCYELDGHKDWKCKIVFDQCYCQACGQAIDWSEEDDE